MGGRATHLTKRNAMPERRWVGGWGPRYLAVKRERGPARVPRLLGEDNALVSVDPFDLEP